MMDEKIDKKNHINTGIGIVGFIKNTYPFFKSISQKRWLRFTVQSIVILFCFSYLAYHLHNEAEILRVLQVNYVNIACVWILTLIAVYLGAASWWLTLRGLGQDVSLVQSVRVHLLSNLAKYVPGYGWQLIGKAYLTNKIGLTNKIIGLAMLFEIGQLVGIGVILIVSLIPEIYLNELIIVNGYSAPGYLFKFLMFIGIIIISIVLVDILRRYRKSFSDVRFVPLFLIGSSLSIFLGWLLFGFSFWLIGASLVHLPWSNIPTFIFALTASFLIGLASIFIPGSIGVRESIMVFLLSPEFVAAPIAVIIAILSRIIITLSELSSLYLLNFILRISKRQLATQTDDLVTDMQRERWNTRT
jgi:glycosyltransferase 2 family protein